MSIWPWRPKCSGVPRPPAPRTPTPWRVIDDEHRVVLAAEGDRFGQLGHVPFHAEDAVGDDPAAGLAGMGLQLGFEIGQVAVLIDFAGDRFADQADAVDDAGVVQLVGEDARRPAPTSVGNTASLAFQQLT